MSREECSMLEKDISRIETEAPSLEGNLAPSLKKRYNVTLYLISHLCRQIKEIFLKDRTS